MFTLVILFFSFLTPTKNSWWGKWNKMELAGFSFIGWLSSYESSKTKLKVFIYFIIQLIASALFFLSNIMMHFSSNKFMSYLSMIALILKVGGFPFHYWMYSIVENMSYYKLFFLMTIMKLAPFMAMSYIQFNLLILLISMSGLLMAPNSYQLGSIRFLLTYSSIIHVSWMIMTLTISKMMFLLYFFCYMTTMLITIQILVMQYTNLNQLKEMMINFQKTSHITIWLLVTYSMMGLPPFLMFYPKFWSAMFLISNSQWMPASILIILSFLPSYFYSKLVFLMLLNIKATPAHPLFSKKYLLTSTKTIFFFIFIMWMNYQT
uniref:NADH dehydrogenase subunit 2 n=1 Tax=Laemobothrion maximum TaxID=2337902 RepID=UPI00257D5303|nr:NADH dehydrogenase subunit 2 [Laemobothrion maximum]WGU50340.1 NADH dehydrogenase subunit 2 [Laemobothrion maximum]